MAVQKAMKLPYYLSVLCMVWLIAGIPVRCQLRVNSVVSSDSMMIGDQLTYRLKVDAADHLTFRMPEIGNNLGEDFEVLYRISADTSVLEGRRVVEHSYLFTGFEQGTGTIPSQRIPYGAERLTDTATTLPLVVFVNEPSVDTTQQIKPIKPPIHTPVTFAEVLPWVIGGMAAWVVLTFASALVWISRQKRRDPEIFSVRPVEPAHVVAFRELDRLKQQKLWEKGEVKEFYSRLTDITRRYIERQYGIPAMERTTGEILAAFRRSNTGDGILDDMLQELLNLADLVKFAREDPLPMDNQTHLNNAYIFIQKTYPMFDVEEPEAKKEVSSGTV